VAHPGAADALVALASQHLPTAGPSD